MGIGNIILPAAILFVLGAVGVAFLRGVSAGKAKQSNKDKDRALEDANIKSSIMSKPILRGRELVDSLRKWSSRR